MGHSVQLLEFVIANSVARISLPRETKSDKEWDEKWDV